MIVDGYAPHITSFRNTEVLSLEEAQNPERSDPTFEPHLSEPGERQPGGLGADCELALATVRSDAKCAECGALTEVLATRRAMPAVVAA